MTSHLVIPDTQVRLGVSLDHFVWIGRLIKQLKPDVIVHIGDHWDMPSLSSYDKGKRSGENKRYNFDIRVGNLAMTILDEAMKADGYKPRKVFCKGNHERRIDRAVNDIAWLDGKLCFETDTNLKELGWEIQPFLEPIVIDDIAYAHFFNRNAKGRILQDKHGAPDAMAQIKRNMVSCTAGHMQGLSTAHYDHARGTYVGVIAGSCYLHDEEYRLTDAANSHWRGVVYCENIQPGGYYKLHTIQLDEIKVS